MRANGWRVLPDASALFAISLWTDEGHDFRS
jgi:hypothetical protein